MSSQVPKPRKGEMARRGVRGLMAIALFTGVLGAASAGGAVTHRTGDRGPARQIAGAVPALRARLAAAATGNFSDGQQVSLSGRNFSPRAAVVVAQCSAQALAAAFKSVSSALDYCDERFVADRATDAAGSFSARARVLAHIQTASGQIDCSAGGCLLGALNLGVLQGAPLQVAVLPLTFRAPVARTATRPAAATGLRASRGGILALVRPAHPARLRLWALPARSLGLGRIGERVRIPAGPAPPRPVTGEGLLALTMSAPGTSWSDPHNTSVVVQARVDRRPWQAIVLFAGGRPFTYEGFTGPLRSGPHSVQVHVRGDLSQVIGRSPITLIDSASLRAVDARTPGGLALQYAPVLYDRRISATGDTPLITYADQQSLPGGAHRPSYVVTWTHEDAGTGFVPWLEWTTWGRMTDIESAISFTVDPAGAVSDTSYLSCTQCGADFPENRTALDETDVPFHGAWFAHHPVLRVSTGNNDFSDQGVTQMRFQQALAAPPPAGDTREGAMDLNPWTYSVMGAELRRERDDFSQDPLSPAPGAAAQYLIVDLDTTAANTSAVGVDIRLSGDPTVYANDFGTTYPFYNGGHGRTVVKVPLRLAGRSIAMLRLRLLAAGGATPSIVIRRIRVWQSANGQLLARRVPTPAVLVSVPPAPLPPPVPAPTLTVTGSSP